MAFLLRRFSSSSASSSDYMTCKWREDIRSVATQNTYPAYEGNTEWEEDNNPPPPSPPNELPPTFIRTPPPHQMNSNMSTPPSTTPIPDDKGITSHEDRRRYKVTLTCTYCRTQYTTEWGEGNEPYLELRQSKWQQGRDGSGNYTWQRARCPNYYQNCGGGQNVQRQLALKY